MSWSTVEEFKSTIKKEGFLHKVLLDPSDFAKLRNLLAEQPGVLATPETELRYMEGLLDLPYGFIKEFAVRPAPEFARCKCGRTPSALDVVSYACRRSVHGKPLIRDALSGLQRIYEISQGGREADCLHCGRKVVMDTYFGESYIYA